MPKIEARYFWLLPISHVRWLWKPLAARIEARTGLRPLFFVASREDGDYYRNAGGYQLDEDQIAVAPSPYLAAMAARQEEWPELSRRARAVEDRFGISLMRSMVQADRHLGRGFIWGWDGFPASYAADLPGSVGALAASLSRLEFVDALAEEREPGLVIGYGSGLGIASRPISLLCEERGIPFRVLTAARLGGAHYWAHDAFENSPDLLRALAETPPPDEAEVERALSLIAPPAAFTSLQRKSPYPRLTTALKTTVHQLAMRLYQRLRGYGKARFGYKPVASAVAPLRHWWSAQRFARRRMLRTENLPDGVAIVSVPLQVEPEVSLQGQSPEASNILSVIYEAALSLPANALLAVKEHPLQIGRRPDWFYGLIEGLPNAVLIDPTESSSDLLRRTDLVVQINSSFGYEAAMRGIAVMCFSPHGPITAVEHVLPVRGVSDLEAIRRLLSDACDETARARRRLEGARFALALDAFTIDLSDLRRKGRPAEPREDELTALVDSLLKSLSGDIDAPGARPAAARAQSVA